MILEVKQWPESQELMDDPEWFPIVDGGEELILGDSAYARIIDKTFNAILREALLNVVDDEKES